MEKIEAANALSPDQLLLSDEKSLWRAEVFIAVSKEAWSADSGIDLIFLFLIL